MKRPGLFFLLFILISACHFGPKEDIVLISTSYGDIKVKLYNKTPLHHDNFLKLVNEKYYDSTLFHRVIQNFMIQGGDPDSRHPKPGQLLGDGGPAYTIPFEYKSEYIHKRGVLAAARESDDINPKFASSGSQFYIVQGKKFDDKGLDAVEKKVERRDKKYILMKLLMESGDKEMLELFKAADARKDTAITRSVTERYTSLIESEYSKMKPFRLSEEQRKIYKTIGGAPHLDGYYTVFGEVISGMDVVDKIAAAQTDSLDRPVKDIRGYTCDNEGVKIVGSGQ
ncbi:MAG: peptidylprolyl isomerase [Bacteroidetes bacterium]|nr:peptidylprolyl isomerase [Bacteroidota bacterium]